jgi:hypothetical protein
LPTDFDRNDVSSNKTESILQVSLY